MRAIVSIPLSHTRRCRSGGSAGIQPSPWYPVASAGTSPVHPTHAEEAGAQDRRVLFEPEHVGDRDGAFGTQRRMTCTCVSKAVAGKTV